MKTKEQQIFNQLVMLSVALGQQQDPKRLQVYVENLKAFDLSAVLTRIESFSRSSRYFPQLVEIIEPFKGLRASAEDMAMLIASEILQCAERYAGTDIKGAKEFLGEKFEIAERFGWLSLTRLEYSELQSARAQLRELAKAYINRAKREEREDLLESYCNTATISESKQEFGQPKPERQAVINNYSVNTSTQF